MIQHTTYLPHVNIIDDPYLLKVSNVILKMASCENPRILEIIRDKIHEVPSGFSSRMLNYYETKGFIFAQRNGPRGKRRFSLIDSIGLEHALISNLTYYTQNESEQDSFMYAGLSSHNYLTPLEFYLLMSIGLLGIREIHLNRDYSNFNSRYVDLYVSYSPTIDPSHLWIMNITKTLIQKLLNEENKLDVKEGESFSVGLIDFINSIRSKLRFPPLFIRSKYPNFIALLENQLKTKSIDTFSREYDLLVEVDDQELIGIEIQFLGNNYIRNPGDSDKVEKLSGDLNRPLKEAIKLIRTRNKDVFL
jgi:hypothetical protein